MGAPPRDSAAVRDYLVDALRLDLIGPRPSDEVLQRERLPQAPSRWHLSSFLLPSDAPQGQRAQDIEEEIDELIEPERGSGERAFLPSSMRLSVLLEASATRLDIAVNWGDYAPMEEQGSDTGAEPDFSNSDASSSGSSGSEATSSSGRRRFSPWIRSPHSAVVSFDLANLEAGSPKYRGLPSSGGLDVVCLVGGPGFVNRRVKSKPVPFPYSWSTGDDPLTTTICDREKPKPRRASARSAKRSR